jgi:DNA-directed RNA polymerase subunit N (RpoN/RPB10)
MPMTTCLTCGGQVEVRQTTYRSFVATEPEKRAVLIENDDRQLCVRQAWLLHVCPGVQPGMQITVTTTKGEPK